MAYTAKDYSKLVGIEGFSETLLKNHFTLYQGYITNTNKILEILEQMLKFAFMSISTFSANPLNISIFFK